MPTDPFINNAELDWFRNRPRSGYFLTIEEAANPILGATSRLGGFPFLPVSESWPCCSKCGIDLFFVGQLGRDLEVCPLPNQIDLLCIYKCSNTECDNWWEEYRGQEFFHLYSATNATSLQDSAEGWDPTITYPPPGIAYERGGPANHAINPEVGEPYSIRIGNSFIDFPHWEENSDWGEIDSSVMDEYIETYPTDEPKLLGHPKWQQLPQYPMCSCGKTMQHLLQLEQPYVELGDAGRLHVFYCVDWCDGAMSVAATWQC